MSQQIGRPKYGAGTVSGRRRRKGGWRPAPIIIIAAVILVIIICWVFGRGCGGNREAKQQEALRTYALEVNKLIERSGDTVTFRILATTASPRI